jgi:hypothetical protein
MSASEIFPRDARMKLWHLTSGEAATSILKTGFKDGEDGGVWFSECDSGWKAWGVVNVTIDIPDRTAELFDASLWEENDHGQRVNRLHKSMPMACRSFLIPAEIANHYDPEVFEGLPESEPKSVFPHPYARKRKRYQARSGAQQAPGGAPPTRTAGGPRR